MLTASVPETKSYCIHYWCGVTDFQFQVNLVLKWALYRTPHKMEVMQPPRACQACSEVCKVGHNVGSRISTALTAEVWHM